MDFDLRFIVAVSGFE